MHARVSTYEASPERVDELERAFSDAAGSAQALEGNAGGYFMVDRTNGRAVTVTLWESEDALRQSAEAADRLRSEATSPSGASITSVNSYEVVQSW